MVINNRRHYRMRQDVDLFWKIEEQGLSGKGRIYNMSASGLQFHTDQLFKIKEEIIFTLITPELPQLPLLSKLKWYRKMPAHTMGYLCGVAFYKNDSLAWKQWMEDNMSKLAEVGDNSILSRFLGHEAE